ncbi:hypothetical protein [Pseudomonas sp. BF-R-01]|uniref:hypothetical protein n=1 Tax=Pseudomonas sp. BF-R-01 TaxID=2832365 RepID=UPI001CBE6833|nr:hypothetical protein [Pseudomonas sp. BF-R-01]
MSLLDIVEHEPLVWRLACEQWGEQAVCRLFADEMAEDPCLPLSLQLDVWARIEQPALVERLHAFVKAPDLGSAMFERSLEDEDAPRRYEPFRVAAFYRLLNELPVERLPATLLEQRLGLDLGF